MLISAVAGAVLFGVVFRVGLGVEGSHDGGAWFLGCPLSGVPSDFEVLEDELVRPDHPQLVSDFLQGPRCVEGSGISGVCSGHANRGSP